MLSLGLLPKNVNSPQSADLFSKALENLRWNNSRLTSRKGSLDPPKKWKAHYGENFFLWFIMDFRYNLSIDFQQNSRINRKIIPKTFDWVGTISNLGSHHEKGSKIAPPKALRERSLGLGSALKDRPTTNNKKSKMEFKNERSDKKW